MRKNLFIFLLHLIIIFTNVYFNVYDCKKITKKIKDVDFEIINETDFWIEGKLQIYNEKTKKFHYIFFIYEALPTLKNLCEYLGFDSLHFQYDTEDHKKRETFAFVKTNMPCCSL